MSEFFDQVYSIVAQIPAGRVVTYGDIARWLNAPRSARVVGWAMSAGHVDIPWQRVVLASGDVAGGDFSGERRRRLEREGVPFLPDGRVDLEQCRWVAPPGVDRRYI
jgi:methylated-DNA-protein-cysteine methyltransferase-like protein